MDKTGVGHEVAYLRHCMTVTKLKILLSHLSQVREYIRETLHYLLFGQMRVTVTLPITFHL